MSDVDLLPESSQSTRRTRTLSVLSNGAKIRALDKLLPRTSWPVATSPRYSLWQGKETLKCILFWVRAMLIKLG